MAGWWEGEAPQENKKKVGLIAAGGAGTAAAIGAGAYLLSRGKAKPKGIKFAPVQPKVKAPKSPRPAPTPKAPSTNVTRITLQPKKTPPGFLLARASPAAPRSALGSPFSTPKASLMDQFSLRGLPTLAVVLAVAVAGLILTPV